MIGLLTCQFGDWVAVFLGPIYGRTGVLLLVVFSTCCPHTDVCLQHTSAEATRHEGVVPHGKEEHGRSPPTCVDIVGFPRSPAPPIDLAYE